jgi:hypothetical protein
MQGFSVDLGSMNYDGPSIKLSAEFSSMPCALDHEPHVVEDKGKALW